MSRHFNLAPRKYMSMNLYSGEVGGNSGIGLVFGRFFSGSPYFGLSFTKKGFTLSSVPANVFGSTALVTDSQNELGRSSRFTNSSAKKLQAVTQPRLPE